MTDLKTEVYLNQLAQSLVPREPGEGWFSSLSTATQNDVLRTLSNLCTQAGAVGKDVPEAIAQSGLKGEFTPCKLLMIANDDEPLGSSMLKSQMSKLITLADYEKAKSFTLLLELLGVSDKRRKAIRCKNQCNHWWHRDLTDPKVIQEILKIS